MSYLVTIIKLEKRENALDNNPQIFEGYVAKGFAPKLPAPDEIFSMLRIDRNGVKRLGFFETSMVQEVSKKGDIIHFSTQNSHYKLEIIEKDSS